MLKKSEKPRYDDVILQLVPPPELKLRRVISTLHAWFTKWRTALVKAGLYSESRALPPTHAFAHYLGVSKSSMLFMLDEQRCNGLVITRKKAGTFFSSSITSASLKCNALLRNTIKVADFFSKSGFGVGDMLPSGRIVANTLGLSLTAAYRALRALDEFGFLEIRTKPNGRCQNIIIRDLAEVPRYE